MYYLILEIAKRDGFRYLKEIEFNSKSLAEKAGDLMCAKFEDIINYVVVEK